MMIVIILLRIFTLLVIGVVIGKCLTDLYGWGVFSFKEFRRFSNKIKGFGKK
jgi:hypothetical protein